MMLNFNGDIQNRTEKIFLNRAFLYGDSVFETIKVVKNKILFWEEHYLRLMSSMRILKIEIPNTFTPEYLEDQIKKTNFSISKLFSGRVRLTIFRDGGGFYTPKSNESCFVIKSFENDKIFFETEFKEYTVDIYKDYFIQSNLLSNLKTNNRLINVLGSIYAKNNGLENCILLNDQKLVAEFLNGNIFIVKENIVLTPPLGSGCLSGVMRNKIIESITGIPLIEVKEENFSAYEIISSQEIWVSNCISGIIPVTEYRNKQFGNSLARKVTDLFNNKISSI
tara:strand:- start:1311 stop:2150 length:840 start_codon:yes stop_codon:yes gene_type:complete